MASFFKASGKPTLSALSFAKRLDAALKEQHGAGIRLHLKRLNARGSVLAGEHNTAARMLEGARVKFWEANDDPGIGAIGDYIGMYRVDAQKLSDKINAANH